MTDSSTQAPFSYAAVDTMFAQDKPSAWRERPTLQWGRSLSDEELLEKLKSHGVSITRERLAASVQQYLSAESLCQEEELQSSRTGIDADWVWVSITVLWERWFPEMPAMEMLDHSMQSGYHAPETEKAQRWLATWDILRKLTERLAVSSLQEFDSTYRGTQSVFNWVTDCSEAFHNASIDEPPADFKQSQRRFIEWVLQTFPNENGNRDYMRGDLGECIYHLDGAEAAEAYFKEWTDEEPNNGQAWYYWSSVHFFGSAREYGLARAEALVTEALSKPNMTEKEMLRERLRDIKADVNSNIIVDSGPAVTSPKVGRNEPCPCGSGKKYKKCCLN